MYSDDIDHEDDLIEVMLEETSVEPDCDAETTSDVEIETATDWDEERSAEGDEVSADDGDKVGPDRDALLEGDPFVRLLLKESVAERIPETVSDNDAL